jgi:hypothetical protein
MPTTHAHAIFTSQRREQNKDQQDVLDKTQPKKTDPENNTFKPAE